MSWTRATASDAASRAARRRQQRLATLAACVLALLLVGAATFSRTWHALEFKTFDVLTALTAPQRTALPHEPLSAYSRLRGSVPLKLAFGQR